MTKVSINSRHVLLKEIPLTLMRDRDDTANWGIRGGMRRGVLHKHSVPDTLSVKTPRLIPPLCLHVRVVIPNEMIPRNRGIIEMRDLPIIMQEAKNPSTVENSS